MIYAFTRKWGQKKKKRTYFIEFVVDETVDECGFAHTNVAN